MDHSHARNYTSKIIRAGALLADTKTLLHQWDETLSIADNLKRAREDNIFGKNSRSWISQFLRSFRQRYLTDPANALALVALAKGGLPPESLNPILYFYVAQDDPLLHAVVTDLLLPFHAQGRTEVSPDDTRRAIRAWIDCGLIPSAWSENTISRATRNLMATLRDFGILQGAARKKLATVYLPVEAFAFIAFVLHRNQPSGGRLIAHPEWQLFFLTPPTVEGYFGEAHQRHLLEYQAAGSIVRITFPASTLEEYAHVILQRAA
jgi:hypothetical protein